MKTTTTKITRGELRILSVALNILDGDDGIKDRLAFLKSCNAIFDTDKYESELARVKKMNKPENYDVLFQNAQPLFGKPFSSLTPEENEIYLAYQHAENTWADSVNELMNKYSDETVEVEISLISESEFESLISKNKPDVIERDEAGKPLKDKEGNFIYLKKKQNEKLSQRGKALIVKYFVK